MENPVKREPGAETIAQPKPIRVISPLDVPVIFKESIKFFSVNLGPRKVDLFPEEPGDTDIKTLLNPKESRAVPSSKSFVQPPSSSKKAALAKEKSSKLGLSFNRPQKPATTEGASPSSTTDLPKSGQELPGGPGNSGSLSLNVLPTNGEQPPQSLSRKVSNGPDSMQELLGDPSDSQTRPIPLDRGNSDTWRRALMEEHFSSKLLRTKQLGASISTVQELVSFEDLSEPEERGSPPDALD